MTEKTCPHGEEYSLDISGTELRKMIAEGTLPPIEYIREEISVLLLALKQENLLFVDESDIN